VQLTVEREILKRPPIPRNRAAPPAEQLRGLTQGVLCPEGGVIFEAAGFLFQQAAGTQECNRLRVGNSFETLPSLDAQGQRLAFVCTTGKRSEVIVRDLSNGNERVVTSGASYGHPPSWSPDGRCLLVAAYRGGPPEVLQIPLQEGDPEPLVTDSGWLRRPHYAGDGTSIFFTAKQGGRWKLCRSALKGGGVEVFADLPEGSSAAVVSQDGKLAVVRRGRGLAVMKLGSRPSISADTTTLTTDVVSSFSLSPDGTVVYGSRGQLWSCPVTDGSPQPISLNPTLKNTSSPPLQIRRVRLLDPAKGCFSPETTLLIRDGRIDVSGSSGEAIQVLDAGGRFAIPGLFDFHAHAQWAGASAGEAFLAYGVTSVRDPGGSLAATVSLAERSARTGDALPRFFFSGDPFQGEQTGGSLTISTATEARHSANAWRQAGAHFLKVYPSLRPALQFQVAREAQKIGIPWASHGMNLPEIVRGVSWGCTVLEHCLDHDAIGDDVIQLLVESGTRWTPTVVMHGGSVLLGREEPARLQDDKLMRLVPAECCEALFSSDFIRGVDDRTLQGEWALRRESIRRAFEAGVKIHAGTDDHGADWLCLPGLSLHWELELLVEAGVSPLAALRMATHRAAEALGVDTDLGCLEAGKLADIVLLDANPLENIRHTQRIWRVIKGGRVFDPERLGDS
jgi:imidazolonepropionase-like amidohydrolase